MSPEMVNSILFGLTEVSSPACIDGYGLSLVAMHLFGSLCQHIQYIHSNILCSTAMKFLGIMHNLQDHLNVDKHNATKLSHTFDKIFKQRSLVITKAYNKMTARLSQGSSTKTQITEFNLLKLLSIYLGRKFTDKSFDAIDHHYILSTPMLCIPWRNWRAQLLNINVRANL